MVKKEGGRERQSRRGERERGRGSSGVSKLAGAGSSVTGAAGAFECMRIDARVHGIRGGGMRGGGIVKAFPASGGGRFSPPAMTSWPLPAFIHKTEKMLQSTSEKVPIEEYETNQCYEMSLSACNHFQ